MLWLLCLPIWSALSTISGITPPPDWFENAKLVLLVYAPYSGPGYVAATDVAIFVTAALLLSTATIVWTIATNTRNVLGSRMRAKPAPRWLMSHANLGGGDVPWLLDGIMAIRPFMAPIFTLGQLVEYTGSDRWKFWLRMLAWCTLDSEFATAMVWAALKSFDYCLGRMTETSVSRRNPSLKSERPGADELISAVISYSRLKAASHKGTARP